MHLLRTTMSARARVPSVMLKKTWTTFLAQNRMLDAMMREIGRSRLRAYRILGSRG